MMSPTQRSYELGEASKAGSLLTMFLTGPLMGFCLTAGNTDPSIQQLVDLQVRCYLRRHPTRPQDDCLPAFICGCIQVVRPS